MQERFISIVLSLMKNEFATRVNYMLSSFQPRDGDNKVLQHLSFIF